MIDVTLTITLTFRAPVLTKSTSAGGYGIDASFARDENGDYLLPRSLVKGRLKQSFLEQEDLGGISRNEWAELMGDEADPGSYRPNRGTLEFTNLIHPKSGGSEAKSYRIQIDDHRRAVMHNALLVIDSPFAPGSPVDFTGKVRFFAVDRNESKAKERILRRGLAFMTCLGAEKSVGFGELTDVRIDPGEREMTSTVNLNAVPNAAPLTLDFVIRPESPFCLTKDQIAENTFESDKIITGGAIKGCFATSWLAFLGTDPAEGINNTIDSPRAEYADLWRNFEKIRFTHAMPAPAGSNTRPLAIPFSMAAGKKDTPLVDLAAVSEACLLDGAAPAFQMDWKRERWNEAEKLFAWDLPPTKLEVRNRHDRDRRKAMDENLFAYQMVIPDGHKWLGRIDFGDIEDDSERFRTIQQLNHLIECLGTLRFLGKTKARADIKLGSGIFRDAEVAAPSDERFVFVYLQTPALMLDPSNLDEFSGAEELSEAYRNYWSELPGKPELSHYFARQRLAGGEYVWKRFGDGGKYMPFLLTEAGSVFALKKDGLDLGELTKAVSRGLPLDKSVRGRHGIDWKSNPYIPENGYGEVRVYAAGPGKGGMQ
ncbi:MAG: hypothetical protein IPN69_01710 [Acidobacteria bacterium]|nr:hypothetical protein [Acidobacteriota bacterium]